MKWKKILFVCLSLVFVFGIFFLNKNITFAAIATYDSSNNTIDGQAVTGKIDSGDIIYYNTNNGFYSQPKSNSGSGQVYKNENTNISWTDIENANKSWGQIASENLSPSQIASTAAKAAAEQFTSGFMKDIINGFLYLLAWLAQNVLLKFVALLVGIAGLLFEKIIDLTVINMSTNLQINDNSSFINIGWTILRDIINIMFIFVLLYVGIKTIIKGFESDTSKMITTVIVVALIINFSLFFTKIIIDTSNIVAVNFYESIKAQSENNWAGIAAIFIKNLGLTTQYNPSAQVPSGQDASIYTGLIIGAIGGSIVLGVLGVIILIACIMFVSRYIILIFVLIASAAAIGSWILPKLKSSVYDKWFSALIGQSFFAPVFMLFIYLTALFTTTINISISNLSWVDLFTQGNPSSQMNLVINYVIVIGSLIGTIIISQSLSNMAGKGAGQVNSIIGGGALGLASVAGRRLGGGIGNSISQSKTLQGLSQSENAWVKRLGLRKLSRGTMLAGNSMKKGNWDLRSAPGISSVIGATGMDLGKSSDNTYEKGVDAAKKKLEERKKLYGYKDPKADDISTSDESFKDELARDEKNAAKRDKAEKEVTNLKSGILSAEKELAKLDARLKVAVENKDEKLAESIAENMADIKEDVKNKQESLKINQGEVDTINKMIQTRVAANSSTYLNQKSGSWFSQMKKEAAKRIIEDQKKTKTDFDKLLKELQEKKDK